MKTLKEYIESSNVCNDAIPVRVNGDYYFTTAEDLLSSERADWYAEEVDAEEVGNHWEEDVTPDDYTWLSLEGRMYVGIW